MANTEPGSARLITPQSRTPSSSKSTRRQIPWIVFLALVFCAGAEWVVIHAVSLVLSAAPLGWKTAFVLGGLHIILSIILIEAVHSSSLPQVPAWRGGLSVSLALALTGALVLTGRSGIFSFLLLLLAGWMGAFIGVLAATALHMGLWEDNAPPSEEVLHTVYQCHQTEMGSPIPGSFGKRIFDIGLSVVGLILSLPVHLIIAAFIWVEDPGPVIFVKNSVGKGGVNFHQYKFRTMVRDAEKTTGPVLANGEADDRVLKIGRLLRKTALDELPQLFNILAGEMSFVGPRPQRTVLAAGYLDRIPGYAKRHRIAPGLAGLAQVAGSYYIPPEEKLRWDLIYIERACLSFDLKLILLAFMIVFWYRWQKDWDEHLPNRWLKIQNKPI